MTNKIYFLFKYTSVYLGSNVDSLELHPEVWPHGEGLPLACPSSLVSPGSLSPLCCLHHAPPPPQLSEGPCMYLCEHLTPHVQVLSTCLRNTCPLATCQVQWVPPVTVVCLQADRPGEDACVWLGSGLGADYPRDAHPFGPENSLPMGRSVTGEGPEQRSSRPS